MTDSAQTIFEVHVSVGDDWSVYSAAHNEERAVQIAISLLAMKQFDAVKVTLEDDRGREKVVYKKEGGGGTGKFVTISPVDEAPLCRSLEDYYRFESRRTVGRVLRRYLDQTGITALELMHNSGHMKWFCRNERLYVQSVQNVATVQSKANHLNQTKRMNEVYAAVDEVTERAMDAENALEYYLMLKEKGIQAMVDAVAENVDEKDRDFMIRAALATHIGDAKGWDRKFELMIIQAETHPGVEAMAYVDEVMAEIFDGADAVKELLGYQRTLGEAMQTLISVGSGRYEPQKRAGRFLDRLNKIMPRHDMTATRGVMLERVQREIGGVKPLSKEGELSEEDAFSVLIHTLIEHKAIADGGGISEAATLRAKMVYSDDGLNESSEIAIESMLQMLPSKAIKVQYLLDLVGSDFGQKNQHHIISQLARIVRSLRSVSALVETGAGREEVLEAAARIRDRLLSTKLPDHWRLRFARKIYNLLIDYNKDAAAERKAASEKEMAATASGTGKKSDVDHWGDRGAKKKDVTVKRDRVTPKKRLKTKSFAAGEFIFREGDPGDEAYLIKSGLVAISRLAGDKDVAVAEAGPGSIIGEMALIDSLPRMATACAKKKTLLTVIPMESLTDRLNRLEKFDPVLRRMMDMFVQRMRDHPIIEQ
ncbi:MAG: cyclic nucleotide-binding domain-containing protein [Rhodospirillales bacterium]|mgnify:CR=1 FL=1|nr:cyclic nucleotide-binding domain-containing protein [Rhodospirillales bacterium]